MIALRHSLVRLATTPIGAQLREAAAPSGDAAVDAPTCKSSLPSLEKYGKFYNNRNFESSSEVLPVRANWPCELSSAQEVRSWPQYCNG